MKNCVDNSGITSKTIKVTVDESLYNVCYNLIRNQYEESDVSNFEYCIYSVSVALYSITSLSDYDSNYIFDITHSKDTAQQIFDIIVDNEVFPSQLNEVVEDLIVAYT